MAVARSLLMSPGAVLADEPTAGLDDESTADVLRLLRETADDGAAVLVVTHEDEAMRFADRTLTTHRASAGSRRADASAPVIRGLRRYRDSISHHP